MFPVNHSPTYSVEVNKVMDDPDFQKQFLNAIDRTVQWLSQQLITPSSENETKSLHRTMQMTRTNEEMTFPLPAASLAKNSVPLNDKTVDENPRLKKIEQQLKDQTRRSLIERVKKEHLYNAKSKTTIQNKDMHLMHLMHSPIKVCEPEHTLKISPIVVEGESLKQEEREKASPLITKFWNIINYFLTWRK